MQGKHHGVWGIMGPRASKHDVEGPGAKNPCKSTLHEVLQGFGFRV